MAAIHVIPARDGEGVKVKLSTLILARVMEKPDACIAVFAGTPAFGLYRNLTQRAVAEAVDFSRVRFVVFDELVKQPGETPFRRVLEERLFLPLAVPPDNVLSFDPSAGPAPEAARFSRWLSTRGIDLALLSVDSRGHLGFHTEGADPASTAGPVSIENAVRWQADQAFSLGLRDVAAAGRILLFAEGENHAEVIQRLLEGSFGGRTPISILQRHPDVLLIADRGALSRVAREERISGFVSGYLIMDAATAPRGRTIVVVSPHPDDAPISLGGTLAMLGERNRIVTAVMSTGHRAFIYGKQRDERIAIREAESVRESRGLGAEPRFLRLSFYDRNYEVHAEDVDAFGALLDEVAPDWIFLPHLNDQHPAHIASRKIAREALGSRLRGSGATVEAWNYEGPWAMFTKGGFNTIVSISSDFFVKKTRAIRAHESQVARTPFDVAAESLARLRSSLVPEAELAGYGAQPPKLEPYLELFHRESLHG